MEVSKWDGRVNLDEDISQTRNEVWDETLDTAVSRSPFQLARFVVHSHGTLEEGAGPIMRQQALREIETCMEGIVRCRIEIERAERKIKRLRIAEPEDFDLDLQEQQLVIRKNTISLTKKLREYKVLKAILDELPRYSWEEFNELEPKRWSNRLLRQCEEYNTAIRVGLDRGDIMAIRQAQSDDVLAEIGKMSKLHAEERKERIESDNGRYLKLG